MMTYIKHKTSFSKHFIFALTLVFSLSFFSCNNLSSDSSQNQRNNEQPVITAGANKGIVKISLKTPEAKKSRTGLPDNLSIYDFTNFKLTGYHDEKNYDLGNWEYSSYLQNESIELEAGEWSLTLSASYKNFSYSSVYNLEVQVGSIHQVDFVLSTDSMSGDLSVQINFDSYSQVDHVNYQIVKYPAEENVESGSLPVYWLEYNKYVLLTKESTEALQNGTYRLLLSFYADTNEKVLLNKYSELIRIKGGRTTTITRFISLNELFTIHYMNIEDAEIVSGSLIENYSINSDYSQITFPELSRPNYIFRGWLTESGTSVTSLPAGSTGDQWIYADWVAYPNLSYKLVNYSNNTYTIPSTALSYYGLPATINPDIENDLSACTFTDGESNSITYTIYSDSACTSAYAYTGNKIPVGAILEDKTLYIKPVIDHVYVDPSSGNDTPSFTASIGMFPFEVGKPAQSVAVAREWVGTGDAYTLIAKSALTSKTDIENISAGPIVKAHSSLTSTMISPSSPTGGSSLSIHDVTLDGGAVWGTIDTDASVYGLTNTGRTARGGLINTYNYTMENVIIQNNDNTLLNTGALYVCGNTSLTNCVIRNNRCAGDGGGITVEKGSLSITGGEISHNAAIGASSGSGGMGVGGAINCARIDTTATSPVIISGTTIKANKAKLSGGAICLNQHYGLCTIDGCTFTNNTLNDSAGNGQTICDLGNTSGSNLYLKGNISIDAGNIYTDVTKPITVDSTTKSTGTLTAIPVIPLSFGTAPDFDKQLLTATNTDDIAAVKGYFTLRGTNAANYVINDAGYIKPKPGYVQVTPGFPGTYKCGYTMVKKGNSGKIKLILKDSSNAPVSSSLINSLKVSLYETGDLIKTWTGTSENNFSEALNFDYPHYIDDPTDTSFYVEVSIKPSDTSDVAYSYDFWAENNGIFVTMLNVTVPSINFNSSTTLCADDAEKKSKVFIANRNITIESLIVSDHETTQAEYLAVMGENPSYFSDSPADGENQDKRPVDGASWYDVLVYCNKRSILEGLTPCYTIKKATDTTVDSTDPNDWGPVPDSNDSRWNAVDCNFNANGYRLPTEAEWEYCARGGTLTDPQFTYSGTTDSPDNYVWHSWNSSIKTHEVKKKTANALGLYDMSGNLMEWCWDYFIYTIDNSTPATGPISASSGNKRVVRDGSYMENPTTCAVIHRDYHDPDSGVNYIGFRVVRTAD